MATSSSVSTDWTRSAGNFTCKTCRRKRLPASEFSKSQARQALAQGKKSGNFEAKCKACVQKAEEEERKKSAASGIEKSKTESAETLVCSKCKQELSMKLFSRSQAEKIKHSKPGKCKQCVESLEAAEAKTVAENRNKKLEKLKGQSKLKGGEGVAARLALACLETAQQAEKVTGISARNRRGTRK
mmetsp:Transcript_5915/g.6799  ORF Transcript_5915/g.6799 Transcript_5915/m.6799 type:complete len:186 (-) Transcript_5915:517-1074(-)